MRLIFRACPHKQYAVSESSARLVGWLRHVRQTENHTNSVQAALRRRVDFSTVRLSRAHRRRSLRLWPARTAEAVAIAGLCQLGLMRLPILELNSISKHFGAIHAVNDVSLSIEPGEV